MAQQSQRTHQKLDHLTTSRTRLYRSGGFDFFAHKATSFVTLLGLSGLLGSALLADANEASVGASATEGSEHGAVGELLVGGDGAVAGLERGASNREGSTLDLSDLSALVSGSVELLGSGLLAALLHGEDDELRLVQLQALNVSLEGPCRLVAAAVVNRDADGGRELTSDASLL